jgi:hypothetical protein
MVAIPGFYDKAGQCARRFEVEDLASDMWRYQGARRKGQWPTTHALNVDKHGGFAPGLRRAATGPWAARNTMRLRRGIENRSSICG